MASRRALTIVDLVLRKVIGFCPLFESSFQNEPVDQAAGQRIENTFLEVRTDAGVTGLFGPVGPDYSTLLLGKIRRRVVGLNPLASERVMHEATQGWPHARSGYYRMALGALDCALWDIRGKILDCPVYLLLGGPVQSAVPCYATMLGFDIDGNNAGELALRIQQENYRGQKWRLREGLAEGQPGLQRNLRRIAALRKILGPDYPLMFDVIGGWTSSYALQFCRAALQYDITWLEEPLPAAKVFALASLRHRCEVPVAAGEHAYTLAEVHELLVRRCVDYLQTDPGWCGISETLKIIGLCEAWDIPLVQHGNGLIPALHIAASRPSALTPMVEYHVTLEPKRQYFLKHQFSPSTGSIALPDRPGLGIELDEDKIVEGYELRSDDLR